MQKRVIALVMAMAMTGIAYAAPVLINGRDI